MLTVIYNNIAFDVKFNGSHENNDSDALCFEEIREKRPGCLVAPRAVVQTVASPPQRRLTHQEAHTAGWPARRASVQVCLERQPSTAYELALATGLSDADVQAVLGRFRGQGLIQSERIPMLERSRRQSWTRYRWRRTET